MPIIKGAASEFTNFQKNNALVSSAQYAPAARSRSAQTIPSSSSLAANVLASQVSITASGNSVLGVAIAARGGGAPAIAAAPVVPPTAPASLTFTNATNNIGSLLITSAGVGALTYSALLYSNTASNTSGTLVSTTPITNIATPTTFSLSVSGNYYYVQCYSSNTAGLSATATTSLIIQTYSPAPVISFTGGATGSLTITAAQGASSYSAALYSNTTNSTIGGTLVTTTPITNIATPTTFSSLVVGTYYYIQCSSSNTAGLSPVYATSTTIAGVPSSLANSGQADAFIAKYTSSGSVAWIAQIGGTVSDYAYGVAVDSTGNVIVAGYYISSPLTAYNAGGSAFGTTLARSGALNTFIAKYNSSGSVAWIARLGGASSDYAYGVAVDSGGNVIVAGYFSSTTLTAYNAGGTAFGTVLANSGPQNAFIAKYNSSGSVVWLAKIGGTSYDLANAVAVDSTDNVIVAGYFLSSTLTAYNAGGSAFGTTLALSGSKTDFIAKYNSSGSVAWIARIGGASSDTANAVAVDSGGNVIVAGYFTSTTLTAYNAGGSAFGTTLTNLGGLNTFIAKYNSSGSVVWLAKIGGTLYDYSTGIAVDSGDNVIVSGYFSSTTLTAYNSGGGAFGTTLTKLGGQDAYIAKYDSSGSVAWIARLGGTTADDAATGLAVDSSGNVIVAGYYDSATLTAYNSGGGAFGTTLTKLGGADAYIAKYTSSGNVVWLARLGGATDNERANAVAVDSTGNAIVSGYYGSTTLTAYNA